MSGHEFIPPDEEFRATPSPDEHVTEEMRLADIKSQVAESLAALLDSDALPTAYAASPKVHEAIFDFPLDFAVAGTGGPGPTTDELPTAPDGTERHHGRRRIAIITAVGLLAVGLPSGALASGMFKHSEQLPAIVQLPAAAIASSQPAHDTQTPTTQPESPTPAASASPVATPTESISSTTTSSATPTPSTTPTPSKAPALPGTGVWKEMARNPGGWSFSYELRGQKWMVYVHTGNKSKIMLVPPDAPKGVGYVLTLGASTIYNGQPEAIAAQTSTGSKPMQVTQATFDGYDVFVAELGDDGASAQAVDILFMPPT